MLLSFNSVSILVFCIRPCAASHTQIGLAIDEKHHRDAVTRNPRDPVARAEYGRWLSSQQRYLEAEVEARAAVNAVPTDPAFRADLASVLAATDPSRAEAEFEQGLESGDNADLRAAYARFLLTVREDPLHAAREWKQAAQSTTCQSQRSTFLLAAARASEAAGGTTQATTLYAAAVEADRTPATLSAHASFLRHVLRDYRNAELAYSGALELDPHSSDALLGYATFLEYVRRQNDRAEAMYLRAVEQPSDAQARFAYAKFLMKVRGDYESARSVVDEAVSLNPAIRPAWAKVLSWPTLPTVRDCLRFDAAELLACTMLVLLDMWTKF